MMNLFHFIFLWDSYSCDISLKGVSAQRQRFSVLLKDALTGMDTWFSEDLPLHFNGDMDL